MKPILALSVLALVLLSCDRPKPVLEISNHLWPEGTAISVIHNGKVIAATSLFGDHVRIDVPKRGAVKVRAASPAVITAISPDLVVEGGVVSYRLPVPVMRRQVGTVNLGLGCTEPKESPLFGVFAARAAASVTSLSIPPKYELYIAKAVEQAHAKAIEVLLRADCGSETSPEAALKTALACADLAERTGADGVLFIPGDACVRNKTFPGEVRKLAASVRGRGMSLTVALSPAVLGAFHPAALFDQVPAPECPDDLLLLCHGSAPSDKVPAVVSTQQVEEALLKIMEEKIPLSRVSIEVRLSALATGKEGKAPRPVALAPGDLKRVLAEAGTGSALRLGDGTLLLGYKGVDYQYEDLSGIARKMQVLRSGEFLRLHGVRVLRDGLGLMPDVAGMKELAGMFGGK